MCNLSFDMSPVYSASLYPCPVQHTAIDILSWCTSKRNPMTLSYFKPKIKWKIGNVKRGDMIRQQGLHFQSKQWDTYLQNSDWLYPLWCFIWSRAYSNGDFMYQVYWYIPLIYCSVGACDDKIKKCLISSYKLRRHFSPLLENVRVL